MTSFHEEVMTIRNHWVYGRITKTTAIVEFETLLHNYGLLPEDEEVNPVLSDAEFISLLNQATSLKPDSVSNVRQHQAERKFNEQAQSLKLRCPVCNKPVDQIFREVNVNIEDENQGSLAAPMEPVKLDPPRCEECCRTYMDEYVFGMKRSYIPDTVMADMSLSERHFFRQYEEQMKKA